jgi:hypothetical protein
VFALKMETAGSSKMLAIGNMAPSHHNPSDHNKLYFHENPDLWLKQLLVVGQAFYIYDSPDYIAVFHSTEEVTCKLLKASNLTLYIHFQG